MTALVIGRPSKALWSSPKPEIHSPRPVVRAASARAVRRSATEWQQDRSRPVKAVTPNTGCMCPSTRPGVSVAPPRSWTTVEAPRHSATSPTATIRPSLTATPPVKVSGSAGSSVRSRAPVIRESAADKIFLLVGGLFAERRVDLGALGLQPEGQGQPDQDHDGHGS